TFCVKLFLFTPSRSAAPAAPEAEIRGYRGKRIRVLVADDDPNHIGLMRELLAPLGFMIFSARDGASCLEQFERHQPDLVLLDVSMPILDGWEVARQLHRPSGNKTAIVMISANVSEVAAANKDGMPHDRFLLKPIEVGRLLATIRELLRLEWTCEAPDRGDQLVGADVPIAAQLQFDAEEGIDDPGDDLPAPERLPGRAHLDTLVELGRIGHVDAIEAKLQEIERADGSCGAFVSRSRALVRDFQLKRFVTSLEHLRRNA
ncbi:MAG TPA: response regulator, partial [Stellaceae bacterium]|nr:response regulator [Stellaceae bacterium]